MTPAKSLTLGPLSVPDEYFADFFRGCVDGDGSILTYTDRYHTAKNERYVYDRLYVSIVSASQRFIEWLGATVSRLIGVTGSITVRHQQAKNPIWKLRYAKAQSLRVLAWMYYTPNVPCLARKRLTAERFLSPLGYAPARSTGRPRVGWDIRLASRRRRRRLMVSFVSQHTYPLSGGVLERQTIQAQTLVPARA